MFEREMKELSQIGHLGVSLYFPFILVEIISGKYHYCKAEAALYASFQASVCFYPGLTPSFFFSLLLICTSTKRRKSSDKNLFQ